MAEESVMVDNGATVPAVEESASNEVEEKINIDETKEESQETETKPEGEEGEVKLTEKGTKLDPNPQSAIHQELANAKRLNEQMGQVLKDPALLKKYAEQNGMTLSEAKAEIKEEKVEVKDFTPDQFKTAEDVATTFNKINKTVKELKEENQSLREGQKGINSSREADRIANTMQKDITTVQEKYPELNPTSPDFDKKLESDIGSLYKELDFDPATNAPRGKVSLVNIADKIMSAAGRSRKQGSQEAQTNVKVKQAGKVTSGKGTSKGASVSKDPGTAIAQKINKALTG